MPYEVCIIPYINYISVKILNVCLGRRIETFMIYFPNAMQSVHEHKWIIQESDNAHFIVHYPLYNNISLQILNVSLDRRFVTFMIFFRIFLTLLYCNKCVGQKIQIRRQIQKRNLKKITSSSTHTHTLINNKKGFHKYMFIL